LASLNAFRSAGNDHGRHGVSTDRHGNLDLLIANS
jgi:hypothetical protein